MDKSLFFELISQTPITPEIQRMLIKHYLKCTGVSDTDIDVFIGICMVEGKLDKVYNKIVIKILIEFGIIKKSN
jgi:hypothetical protein